MNGSNAIDGEYLCNDWNCTSLLLEEYYLESMQIEKGACQSSADILVDLNINAAWYKGCKESVFSLKTGKMG